MAEKKVHKIPIVSIDDPKYAHLAEKVAFPASEPGGAKFYPAHTGFNVGGGSDVDVSFLYSHRDTPTAGFDRHIKTHEMFVPLEGDFCIPLAPCKDPNDPDEVPTPDDFVAAVVPQGEAIILKPNVWHNGGWPLDPAKGTRYIMVLSGHRAGAGHQGRVDHIGKEFANDAAIYPEWGNVRK